MPYTYNPATGGYDYDPNGAIPDTGGNNYSDTGMNPQNPFNFNYGNGSSWAGYGDNQNNNPQWPGGTYNGQVAPMPQPRAYPDNENAINTSGMGMGPNPNFMGAPAPIGSNFSHLFSGGDVYNPDILGTGKTSVSNGQFAGFDRTGSTDVPVDLTAAPTVATPNLPTSGTSGLSPDISSYNPTVDHNALLQTARDAATANEAAQANRPAQTGSGAVFDQASQYRNLFGGFNPGWQQGFNELYNKQFTSGSDEFNRVFGSTQGAGYGNNFNWNIQPGLVTDNLYDETFRTQAESVARANPQITFEPVMVDGKWYLASRAQDQSAQKSLLAPVLPPSGPATSGGGGGGSSSGSKFVNYGSKGTSSNNTSSSTSKPAAKPVSNPWDFGGKGGAKMAPAGTSVGSSIGIGPHLAPDPAVGSVTPDGQYVYQGRNNGGWVSTKPPSNQPYTPVSGTGAGYVPMLPPSLSDAVGIVTGIANGAASITGRGPVEGDISPDGYHRWHNGQWVVMS